MVNLRNFSIRARLYVLAAVAIFGMLLIGGDGLWSLSKARNDFGHYVDNDVQSLTQLADIRAGVGNLRRYEKDLLINLGDPALVERYRKSWNETHEGVGRGLAVIAKLHVTSTTRAMIADMEKALQDYKSGFVQIAERVGKGEFSDTAAANKALEPIKGPVRALDKQLEELTQLINKQGAEEVERLAAEVAVTRNALLSIMLLGMVVIGTYTLFNIRSILQPLSSAVASTERIAAQDLSQTIDVKGHDETAAMMRGVQGMQASIREVVAGVRSATDSIATASNEVAVGSQDLSQRTENTASNLEQTASAMEQLTASVKHNADSARQANQLALDAAQVARRGGDVVGEVVHTMSRISTSSHKISDIISVIDGIAFQTNILALNAAVEAARAGEQGRGFAVVASEVRSLAQRSAEAAKEIKGLISASAESVEAGSVLVERAGQTMQDVIASIERVSHIVGEISTATAEQNTGISQIGQAITQLDTMTQQNAALVEESAAAAQSLQSQADQLARTVSVFKLA